jgi:hypothetical protein
MRGRSDGELATPRKAAALALQSGLGFGEGPSEMSKLDALESRATFAERTERPRNVSVLIDELVE